MISIIQWKPGNLLIHIHNIWIYLTYNGALSNITAISGSFTIASPSSTLCAVKGQCTPTTHQSLAPGTPSLPGWNSGWRKAKTFIGHGGCWWFLVHPGYGRTNTPKHHIFESWNMLKHVETCWNHQHPTINSGYLLTFLFIGHRLPSFAALQRNFQQGTPMTKSGGRPIASQRGYCPGPWQFNAHVPA